MQQMGSPARSNAMGLGYQSMNQGGGPNQASGDLLAMMNKGAGGGGGGQLGGLGPFSQALERAQQQHQPLSNQGGMAGTTGLGQVCFPLWHPPHAGFDSSGIMALARTGVSP